MRRYDDPVEVRRGADEDPDQFLWRGRLWQVREVVAHWVETGAWWTRPPVTEAVAEVGAGAGTGSGTGAGVAVADGDLLREREVWRVTAGRGREHEAREGHGVFDLVFSWSEGSWLLARALD